MMSEAIQKFESNVDEILSVFGGEEITVQELIEQASGYLSTLSPAEQEAATLYLTGFMSHMADGFDSEDEEEEEEESEEE
jgi:hypothetical protein